MAFSIEARVPFLDHNVVDFSFSIPQKLKLRGKTEKYILRRAMRDELPISTLKEKKERFFVPIDRWFKGELNDLSKQLLSEENIKKQGVFDYRYIEKVFRNYKKSRLFYSRQLWSIMNFALWHKIYIEKHLNKIPNYSISDLV